MRPKKTASSWSNDQHYPAVLYKLCIEEDVLIIPEFTITYEGEQREVGSPRKSRDSRGVDKMDHYLTMSDSILKDECGVVKPPQLGIIYNNIEDKENPIGVSCKNIYIEYSLIIAIGKSLKFFPSINTLKIENCCISKELTDALASILSEDQGKGKQIIDLSLNGNENLGSVLPLFVSSSNGLKYLSLQRCALSDEDVKALAEHLAFSDEREQRLIVLNLDMNHIGNEGASHLACALRTNRILMYLSLAGNRIDDEGVLHFLEVLDKFELRQEEVMIKRKRIFDEIMRKKMEMEKLLGEWKSKEGVERELSKSSIRSAERNGRKIRGLDGKLCLSNRDKKGKLTGSKMNLGEKFGGKVRNGVEDYRRNAEMRTSEVLINKQKLENESLPDNHPFVTEVYPEEGKLWCNGCWSLLNLNLAYNCITEKSVEKFQKLFDSQAQHFRPPKCGLCRVVLTFGDFTQEGPIVIEKLDEPKKEIPDITLSVPLGSTNSAQVVNTGKKHSLKGK